MGHEMNFKKNESAQKLRGGYYTPPDLALYLSKWVAEANPKTILEPSCGDGVFLEALVSVLSRDAGITAIELDSREARKAAERVGGYEQAATEILCADFLEWYLKSDPDNHCFDAVVGNPPFIRYQYLSEKDQKFSERIFTRHKLRFTRHTNAWVPFVIASLSLLRPGGRMAMVVPAEIFHILHAQSLRRHVGQHCKRIIIIDPEEIWFDGTLQGAVLFLAEKKQNAGEHTAGLGIVPVAGNSFLNRSPSIYFDTANFMNGKSIEGKWTKAFLTKKESDIYDGITSNSSVRRFSEIANVDVGLVTGANKFFLVSDATVEKYNLDKWAHPMFGRAGHCPGVLYDEKQHRKNAVSGLPSNFLWFDVGDIHELPSHVRDYICTGERDNLHTRYKCRIRKPWFRVPSVYSTSVGMLKRAHNMPRLIYNKMKAYTTDTAYRITATQGDARKLVCCFINSLTALSAEIEGRYYGGGVLELVPSEIERLHIPIPGKTGVAMKSLDRMVRNLPANEVLERQDKKVLGDLGLSNDEIACMQNSWDRLRKRRQRALSGKAGQ